jgi:hypothetical protein
VYREDQRLRPWNIQDQAYELSLKLAQGKLVGMDVKDICARTGARREEENRIVVDYLNRPYVVSLPDGEVRSTDGLEIPLKDKILILHYLTFAKGTPLRNKILGYKQLPGIASYYSVFYQLGLRPILDRFGKHPEHLVSAAEGLRAHKVDYGDAAVAIDAFPHVPITIVLWRGDEVFPPQGNIMFDSTVSDYLPLEDLREVCHAIAQKLTQSFHYPVNHC